VGHHIRPMYHDITVGDDNYRDDVSRVCVCVCVCVCVRGHTDAVLCLQFDDTKVLSGSKDTTIKVCCNHGYRCYGDWCSYGDWTMDRVS
jgi:hypothetical protein